ncbi:MAG: hypothetical protein ACREQL_07350 [Candidatus Binatia bacterium]
MKTPIVTTLIAGLVAHPAFAHPGHGLSGWWHHGELLAVMAVVVAAVASARRCSRAEHRVTGEHSFVVRSDDGGRRTGS